MSYIWEKEVKSIKGNLVTFKDKTEWTYTDAQLEYLVTDDSQDDSSLRLLMLNQIIPDVIDVFKKHDIKKGDIQAIMNAVVWQYNETFNIAVGKAFGTFEEGKHTAYFPENIRMSDIEKLL